MTSWTDIWLESRPRIPSWDLVALWIKILVWPTTHLMQLPLPWCFTCATEIALLGRLIISSYLKYYEGVEPTSRPGSKHRDISNADTRVFSRNFWWGGGGIKIVGPQRGRSQMGGGDLRKKSDWSQNCPLNAKLGHFLLLLAWNTAC